MLHNDNDEGNSLNSSLSSGSTLIRKKLIYAALNFINNPRIQSTSTNKKQMFLLKKGLTQDEIDLAFDLCITRPSTDNSLQNELDLLTFSLNSTTNNMGFFSKLLNTIFYIVVFSGFAFGSYTFYQTKIRPRFDKSLQRKDLSEKNYEEILLLKEQILELNKNVIIVHEFIKTYCHVRDDSILSLKNELSSIKSLLVSRSQFPSIPSIPKWQLDNSKNNKPASLNGGSLHSANDHGVTSESDSGDSSKSDN